ncbi:MAG: hypothetical protein BAA03_03520 [Caldibacillus debilis]|nr:MAG: hypothetical protein BAA03_03520 [Caldibacillus debilis]
MKQKRSPDTDGTLFPALTVRTAGDVFPVRFGGASEADGQGSIPVGFSRVLQPAAGPETPVAFYFWRPSVLSAGGAGQSFPSFLSKRFSALLPSGEAHDPEPEGKTFPKEVRFFRGKPERRAHAGTGVPFIGFGMRKIRGDGNE